LRIVPTLIGVSVMVALASPASGEPTANGPDDAGFLASLRSAGLTYTDSGRAIAFAKAVCGSMGKGEMGPQLISELQTDNPALTTDHAASFVALSATYYCPEQLNKR
jgi:hypothetical protein